MERKRVMVSTGEFRSAWVPAALICWVLAALLGVAAAVALCQPEAMPQLIADMILGGVTDKQALQTWTYLHTALTVICFVTAGAMAALLVAVLAGRAGKALLLLCSAVEKLIRVLNVCAVIVLVVFIYKAVHYMFICFSDYDNGMYMLFSMVLFEGTMFTAACLGFRGLQRFLNSLCDGAASIAYTLESGSVDAYGIPALSANGFMFFTGASILIAADRLLTVTIVPDLIQDYYALVLADQPLLVLSGAAFLLAAAGCFSTGMYLRKYKHTSERLYHAGKQE